MSIRRIRLIAMILTGLGCAACVQERSRALPTPVYENDIAALLQTQCVSCHGASDAGAGVVLSSYLDLFRCSNATDAGIPPRTALVDVMQRSDHATLLSAAEQTRLRAWVSAELPLRNRGVHSAHVLDPRAPEWHGRLAARDHFGPILDSQHPDVCGRCHMGAPSVPEGVHFPAPGATACTQCHDQQQGVLACGTCHGDGAARAYPPRDRCLFPDSHPDAHAAHLSSTRLASSPLLCSTCHPSADAKLQGRHADGVIDVNFDTARAGDADAYDSNTKQCTVRCHAQGGARAQPSFLEQGPLGCGDCHSAPPADHYAGTCDHCHHEANADGTALRAHVLHMNGRIDVGNGTGTCAACHGQGDDPMPLTPSHILHRQSPLTAAISCGDCHLVPDDVQSLGHLDRGPSTPADVQFGARARARGQEPTFAAGGCRDVACHGAGLAQDPQRTFVWDAPKAASATSDGCTTCHAAPPSPPHPQDSGCSATVCHGREVAVGSPLGLTDSGRQQHIDGVINHGGP